ncbi:MAG TPA: hypothetical protein VFN11_19210 [Ktedonobacterales bacterium]|nr:hypothetical protein [Ktedonobacterales bacterium]
MERKTSRNLYLASIVIFVVGLVLLIVAGGAASANANSTSVGTGVGIMAIVSSLLFIVGGILATIAWIGALIKTAKLGQWVWFILVILFAPIMMLVYIFAGPTEPKTAAMAA